MPFGEQGSRRALETRVEEQDSSREVEPTVEGQDSSRELEILVGEQGSSRELEATVDEVGFSRGLEPAVEEPGSSREVELPVGEQGSSTELELPVGEQGSSTDLELPVEEQGFLHKLDRAGARSAKKWLQETLSMRRHYEQVRDDKREGREEHRFRNRREGREEAEGCFRDKRHGGSERRTQRYLAESISVTDEEDLTLFSSFGSVATAKELKQHGIAIKGHTEFFPRFERNKFRPWRATLYLPRIKAIGHDTQERWKYLLQFEAGWTGNTCIYDNPDFERVKTLVHDSVTGNLERWLGTESIYQLDLYDIAARDVALWDDRVMSTAKRETCLSPFVADSRNPSRSPRRPFLSYLQFMDDLINTEEDVHLLFAGRNPVILSNNLRDYKAVADLFNSMTRDHLSSRINNPEWVHLSKRIKSFHYHGLRMVFAEFLTAYCGKPWLPISLFAAFTLLVLTLLQTIYTVKSYYGT